MTLSPRYLTPPPRDPSAAAELKGPIGHIVAQDRSVLAVEQNKYIVPGSSGRYVAWGFADHRSGLYCQRIKQGRLFIL